MHKRNRFFVVTLLGLATALAGITVPHEVQAGRVIVIDRPFHPPGPHYPGFRGPGRWYGPDPYARRPGPWDHRPHAQPFPFFGLTAITLKLLDNANEEQQRLHEAALMRATTADVGDTIVWEEDDASGAVTTTRIGRTRSGLPCREFQQDITIGGTSEQAYGTACKQPDGSWKIIPSR